MKKVFSLLCIVLIAALFVGCGPKPQPEGPDTPDKPGKPTDIKTTGEPAKGTPDKGEPAKGTTDKGEPAKGEPDKGGKKPESPAPKDTVAPIDTSDADKKPEPGPSFTPSGKRLSKEMDAKLNKMQAEGDSFLQKGEFEKASAVYDKILKTEKSWDGAMLGKARILYMKKDFKGAKKIVDKLLKTPPVLAGTVTMSGDIKREMGQNKAAIEDYRKAIKINKKDPAPYISAAISYNAINQPQEAIKLLEEGQKLMPKDNPENVQLINYALAEAYIENNDYDKAEKALQKAVKGGSNQVMLYVQLATVYASKGNVEKAYESISMAKNVDPTMKKDPFFQTSKGKAQYYKTFGLILKDRGDYKESAKVYRQAMKLNPSDKETMRELSEALYLTGNEKEAAKLAAQWLKTNPKMTKPEDMSDVAYARMVTGDNEKALELINKSITANDDVNSYLLRGILYSKMNKKEDAIKDLEKVASKGKNGAQTYAKQLLAKIKK